MLLERDRENELSSLSTRPVGQNTPDYSLRRARRRKSPAAHSARAPAAASGRAAGDFTHTIGDSKMEHPTPIPPPTKSHSQIT